MSFAIEADDERHLLKAIQQGNGLLVLGAGASFSSQNARGEPIRMSAALAKLIAERAALPYAGESLKDVLDAVYGDRILSRVDVDAILRAEYQGCVPAPELVDLFKYTWKSLYTWNIDDSIPNINERKSQSHKIFNGMVDKATPVDTLGRLNIIYLHGQVDKLNHGYIFTKEQYSEAITSSWHYWYKQLAQDYVSSCAIFIGSSLDEPILDAEVERAKRDLDTDVGRSYLIVPGELSHIRKLSYRKRGIVHVRGTLKDFTTWLQEKLPGGLLPKDVLSNQTSYSSDILDTLTKDDLDIAQSVKVIDLNKIKETNAQRSEATIALIARRFLEGSPPSWELAASSIPVRLEATNQLYHLLKDSVAEGRKLIVVTGQAGGGKTTGVMSTMLQYLTEFPETSIFELSPDVKSAQRAFRLIKRVKTGHALVHVRDIFVFGDLFRDDIAAIQGGDITVITTARTGEWREHLERYYGDIAETFTFERFTRKDYDPLIERILSYVPAPAFKKKTRPEQHESLNRSKSQLLIALREATESDIFTDIITDEFEKLPDEDTRRLLLCVGVATLARVGIRPEVAQEVYQSFEPRRTYQRALDALGGIVSSSDSRRLFARHELYVRHIIEHVVDFDEIKSVVIEMLRSFVKYNIPVVKSVPRQDGAIFKFLLNHKFIAENEARKGASGAGIAIYQEFEVQFQLDGHYWLQYGLYLAGQKRLSDAIVMLDRSIKAFSGNSFAIHALADVQLRLASNRNEFDVVTRDLVGRAVGSLRALDANAFLEIDEVPLVTLATGHLGILIKFGREDEARQLAGEYFSKLQQMEKATSSAAVTKAKERVFRYKTLGEWDSGHAKRKKAGRHKR